MAWPELLPLLASGAAFLATALGVAGCWGLRDNPVRGRLRKLSEQEEPMRPKVSPLSMEGMVKAQEGGSVLRALAAVFPRGQLARLREQLAMGGAPTSLSGFLALKLALALLGSVAGTALLLTAGNLRLPNLLLVAVLALLGWQFPQGWLAWRIERRQRRMRTALPDALDLITVCVEAGLALDGALDRVGHALRGPLSEEFQSTLYQIGLGRRRRTAFLDLGKRTGVAELTSFVAAVVRAEQSGMSLGPVLRAQAEQMRLQRRQHAEELAIKAPMKMIFPLLLFIFPATFVVILGPAVLSIWSTLLQP